MKSVIGIDEVGRGPIAGPTAVAAFLLKAKLKKVKLKGKDIPLKDSKQLTREEREVWYEEILVWQKEGRCDFCVTMISAKVIDKIGIVNAIKKALEKSLLHLTPKTSHLILLDGGLKASKEFLNQKTIIKGDEKEPIIALASIVAKVTRDRYMCKQAKKYPLYGFESHVGYGTKKHYSAIKLYGECGLHRQTFLRSSKTNQE